MNWFREYVLRARLVTPWGLFIQARKYQKELGALPGYDEIWGEQKRLVLPYFVYIAVLGFLVLVLGSFIPPIVTTTCYDQHDNEISCESFNGPINSSNGICSTNEILEDRNGVWWCVNPEDKRLRRGLDNRTSRI